MLVNLPNGKTVNLTIEQYLSLSDEDIQYMISVNCGSTASSPWCGSAIKKPGKIRLSDEIDDEDVNEGMDEDDLDLDDELQEPVDYIDPEAPETAED